MKHLIKIAAVLLLTVLSFSVSALASDGNTSLPSPTGGAANHRHLAGAYAMAASTEQSNAPATHEESRSVHETEHANLGQVLPLWSCIPFACMLLSIALFPLAEPECGAQGKVQNKLVFSI